jgi:drug/metabolite transporter (DMT)-like permease
VAAAVAYVAVFASILAYWFWNHGVEKVGAHRAGVFICLIPMFTAVLASIFLHESLYAYHAIGALMIISGFFVVHKQT